MARPQPLGKGCRRAPSAEPRGALLTTIIFACVHSAGRSQMAAAFFNRLADPSRAQAVSAGTEPGSRLHPEVIEVMREKGIDLTGETPRLLTQELASSAQWLITMGCGERCPVVAGLQRDDWALEDPKGQPLPRVREIRDDIEERVRRFLAAEEW